jgi:hypothetical protein
LDILRFCSSLFNPGSAIVVPDLIAMETTTCGGLYGFLGVLRNGKMRLGLVADRGPHRQPLCKSGESLKRREMQCENH